MDAIKRFLYWIIKWFMRNFSHTEIIGQENIPESGGCIVLINHLARADIPLFVYGIGREDITALVAKKYITYPLVPLLVKSVDAIWLDRQGSDVGAFRTGEKQIKEGRLMVISPEGTRSPSNALLKGKAGSAFLASRVDVPIIPAAMVGPEIALSAWRRLRKPKMSITFGEPFYLERTERKNRSETLEAYTDEIMCRIAALLPEKYRGVYADHPLLKEFLP